jgi:hypothetical protein
VRIETGAMHTTEPITPTASGPRTFGDAAVEIVPLVTSVFVAGPPVVVAWAGTVVFALLLAGPFVLFATVVVALAAAAAVVTLAGAILATPYLLIRHWGPRLANRRHVSEGRLPIAIKRPDVAVLGESMTARASR